VLRTRAYFALLLPGFSLTRARVHQFAPPARTCIPSSRFFLQFVRLLPGLQQSLRCFSGLFNSWLKIVRHETANGTRCSIPSTKAACVLS
jgi:hypothetical protein